MDERTLIFQAQQGDREAFGHLYGLYKDKYYRYAVYKLRHDEDAEDAIMEAVMKMWQQIGQLKVPEAFGTWSFRILAASCAKLIKGQIRRKEETDIDGVTQETGSAGAAAKLSTEDKTEERLILEEALDQLTEEERDIVLLHVSGLKSAEIAEQTGMAAGSVRSNLSRSMKKMRAFLEG